jgi:hypothetical protein
MMSKAGRNWDVLLPGCEIPNWITHQTIGSSISFPSFLDGKLLLCVVFAANKEAPGGLSRVGFLKWTLRNKTRTDQVDFLIASRADGFFGSCEDHIFVHVMENDLIDFGTKSGDEIELSVGFNNVMDTSGDEIQVKKCGIHQLVDDPNVMDTSGDEIQMCFAKEFRIEARGPGWIELSSLGELMDEENIIEIGSNISLSRIMMMRGDLHPSANRQHNPPEI